MTEQEWKTVEIRLNQLNNNFQDPFRKYRFGNKSERTAGERDGIQICKEVKAYVKGIPELYNVLNGGANIDPGTQGQMLEATFTMNSFSYDIGKLFVETHKQLKSF